MSDLPRAGRVPPGPARSGARRDAAAGPRPGGHTPGGDDAAGGSGTGSSGTGSSGAASSGAAPGRELADPGTLAANYASGGFGRPLEWGTRPALIVIDMVRAYFDPEAEFYMGTGDCLESAARVLASARAAGIPVLHTRVEFDPDGLNGGVFVRKIPALRHFVPGGPLGRIMPQVAPAPREVVIVKQYASAFYGTTLAATLTALRVDTLIITGVSTSGCVRATGVDAIQHGYVPLVVRQAVGDRDPRPHEANLFDLQAKYAEVVDEDQIHAWLAGTAS